MPQPTPSTPPHAMFGLFLCLAVVVAIGGCSSSTRLAMDDRPVPQPRPAMRPPSPPAPALKSGLGRPTDPSQHQYTWNGSPNRIVEGAKAPPPPAAAQYPSHVSTPPSPPPVAAAPHVDPAPHQPPPATGLATAPVHLPRGSVLVQPGDTLYGLSRRHGVSISALMETNRLTSLSLQPGQVLKLPAATRHRG